MPNTIMRIIIDFRLFFVCARPSLPCKNWLARIIETTSRRVHMYKRGFSYGCERKR